jgi:protein regulator of cytokinesis 1
MDESNTANSKLMASPQAVRFSTSAMASPPPTDATKVKTPSSNILNQSASGNNRSRLSSAFTPFQAIMTPGFTPRGSQAGMVLLSPGRTITESLNSLAGSTAQQLEEIWDEVGYTPQERASQLSDLLVKFRDQCEQKIAEEQRVAETFHQTIAESKEELRALGEALKALVDPKLLRENTGQSLTDELSNLQDSLEILRSDAEAAKADLKESLDFLVESHQALGRDLDEKWNDVDSDLTMRRREEFHRKAEEMKEEIGTRTGAVIQLLRDCQHLMNDLGIDGQDSTSQLDRKIAGSLVRSKDSSFIMSSKFETEDCTGISSKALEELTNRASELSNEKRKRKTMLQEMGAEIAILWEQLRIPEEEQRLFTDSVKGLGMDTIEKGQHELRRLKSLKANMLGKLVDDARQAIRDLWEETNASETMREEFEAMHVEDENAYDDDLLEKHEEYIQELQDRLEQMKPILRLIERREDILRQRMEYDELQKDSDRLKQRGAAMARQLMEEEKMARRIKKDLPRLTKHLEEKLAEWIETTGEEFQYQGRVYIDVMAQQEDEWHQYKTNEMQMKLKKKQEEQQFEENKYLGKTAVTKKKTTATRPLGDSNRLSNNNERPSSRIRQRNTNEIRKPVRGSSASRSRLTT